MKLPSLKARQVETAICRDGWVKVGQVGSHRQYKHPTKKGKVTIVFHSKDLYPLLLKSIIRQAGLTPDDFLNLL